MSAVIHVRMKMPPNLIYMYKYIRYRACSILCYNDITPHHPEYILKNKCITLAVGFYILSLYLLQSISCLCLSLEFDLKGLDNETDNITVLVYDNLSLDIESDEILVSVSVLKT